MSFWKPFSLLLTFLLLLGAPLAAEPEAPVGAVSLPAAIPAGPRWARNLPIYEINLAFFTPGRSFRECEQKLPELKKLGVGILWFMPLHPTGVKKAFGSPYCVRDYYELNPAYGAAADFKRLVQRIHAMGMYVLMDWVPNHTAWDNTLITAHPEFYKRDAAGNIQQAYGWRDVAQLDYGNKDLWQWMLQAYTYWLKEFDVDGFRCDVAWGVPIEHWNWLRPRLNAVKKNVFMLAEANEARHHPAFDMTYDWNLTHLLFSKPQPAQPARALAAMLAQEGNDYPKGAIRMRFITNHDLNGSNPLREWLGDGIHAWAVLCATLPGKPLLYCGQEIGIDTRLTTPIVWKDSPDRVFYQKLCRLYHDNPALYQGDFQEIRPDNDGQVFAYRRRSGSKQIVVILNLSAQPQTFTLRDAALAGNYTELFTAAKQRLTGQEHFSFVPWEYRVYVRRAVR